MKNITGRSRSCYLDHYPLEYCITHPLQVLMNHVLCDYLEQPDTTVLNIYIRT